MDDWIVNVTGLTKLFKDRTVVNQVDMQVKKGDVLGFLGPNGSGKTTTLRMICGLLTPDAGQGTCLGFDILTESSKIKQNVGYMTQHYSFYTDLSVEENLNFIGKIYQVPDRQARIATVMDDFGLTKYRRHLTSQLSGGWKQRVALAACLLHKPALLLLDEPTAGIDPIARREFWDKIHALSEYGITTLMTTHYMDEAERCTRLAYLAYGDLLLTGTVGDVIKATGLNTWEIKGHITTRLLQEVKALSGVTQAALFGRHIHACGYEIQKIEAGLNAMQLDWQRIEPTLEDAFISMVKKSHGELG
jgi:ABC-2 type transport system ATP-binding protein